MSAFENYKNSFKKAKDDDFVSQWIDDFFEPFAAIGAELDKRKLKRELVNDVLSDVKIELANSIQDLITAAIRRIR